MGQRIKDNLNNTYQSGMWGGEEGFNAFGSKNSCKREIRL